MARDGTLGLIADRIMPPCPSLPKSQALFRCGAV